MLSGANDGPQLIVLELLGGLDDDDERRRARTGVTQYTPEAIVVPRELLRAGYRQDDLTTHRLEVTLIVGGTCLDEDALIDQRGHRLAPELPLDRASAQNLDD
jgi:hypothetical protein